MSLTNEQQALVIKVDLFKDEARKALKEMRDLEAKTLSQIKRFEKVEKTIRDMAREHNIK